MKATGTSHVLGPGEGFLVVCSPGGFDEYFRAVAAGDHDAIEEVSRRLGYSAAA